MEGVEMKLKNANCNMRRIVNAYKRGVQSRDRSALARAEITRL